MLRSSSGGKGGKTISPPERIIKQHLEIGATRGDILLYKPNQWPGKQHSWAGHTGIIDIPVHWNTDVRDRFSIESTPEKKGKGIADGVQEMTFRTWCRPHYVLGIQYTLFIWRRPEYKLIGDGVWMKRGSARGPWSLCIVTVPVSLNSMADQARKYIGVPYGGIWTSMKLAPKEFICSSLVWYCAKQLYGIDISNGSAKTVWPMDIYRSSHTYLKGRKKIK